MTRIRCILFATAFGIMGFTFIGAALGLSGLEIDEPEARTILTLVGILSFAMAGLAIHIHNKLLR